MILSYIAIPYSHPSPRVRRARYKLATEFAAYLYNLGEMPVSPITHSHPIATLLRKDRMGYKDWRHLDAALLRICQKMYVISIPGWEKSYGISCELTQANDLHIPVFFVDRKSFNLI